MKSLRRLNITITLSGETFLYQVIVSPFFWTYGTETGIEREDQKLMRLRLLMFGPLTFCMATPFREIK